MHLPHLALSLRCFTFPDLLVTSEREGAGSVQKRGSKMEREREREKEPEKERKKKDIESSLLIFKYINTIQTDLLELTII